MRGKQFMIARGLWNCIIYFKQKKGANFNQLSMNQAQRSQHKQSIRARAVHSKQINGKRKYINKGNGEQRKKLYSEIKPSNQYIG